MLLETIKNDTLLIVLLCLLLLSVFVELFLAFIEKEKLRKAFKVFPLLILTIIGIRIVPNNPLLYIASFLGFLGDLFIIFEKKKIFFYLGGLSFFVGHLLYLILMLITSGVTYDWYHYLIIVISFVLVIFILYRNFKEKFNLVEVTCAAFYFGILILLLINAITISLVCKIYYLLLVALGYVLFLISDTMLIIKDFIREFKRDDFYVMGTYLLAEISIVFGFLLILVN